MSISLILLSMQNPTLTWDFFWSFHTSSLLISSLFFPLSLIGHFVFLFFSLPLDHLVCRFPPSLLWFFTSSVLLSHLLSFIFTCFSFLFSSSHLFFLAPSPPYIFYSLAFLVCFSPTINDSFIAPCVILVTLLPSFILSLSGWSIRSRCPGGRWEIADHFRKHVGKAV